MIAITRYVSSDDHWLAIGAILLAGLILVAASNRMPTGPRVLIWGGFLLSLIPLLYALATGSIVVRGSSSYDGNPASETVQAGMWGFFKEEETTRKSRATGFCICDTCKDRTMLSAQGWSCSAPGCRGIMWAEVKK